jgi:hypothetical protein
MLEIYVILLFIVKWNRFIFNIQITSPLPLCHPHHCYNIKNANTYHGLEIECGISHLYLSKYIIYTHSYSQIDNKK